MLIILTFDAQIRFDYANNFFLNFFRMTNTKKQKESLTFYAKEYFKVTLFFLSYHDATKLVSNLYI